MKRVRCLFLIFPLLLVLAFADKPKEFRWKFSGISRIVAIGDVHGAYDSFVELLQKTGLIDKRLNWTGGETHLVQTGDVVDRGPDSRKALKLLMSLEKQAAKTNGAVHALIGNHEAMNIYGDLRYVSAEEYASYRTQDSPLLLDRLLKKEIAQKRTADPSLDLDKFRQEWHAKHPLGFVERLLAFAKEGEFGDWLRGHNAIVQVNDIIFLHGGIGPKYAGQAIPSMNNRIRAELNDFSLLDGGITADGEGPLWYRELAQGTLDTTAVNSIFQQLGVSRMVIGHTVMPTVTSRYDGRIWCIDTGMLKIYNGGNPTALIIENGRFIILEHGEFKVAPSPESQAALKAR
ncbi:MAG TPA: metallophosphoesterase [Acidobacteriota bacterium]|jgi:hypothetical protein|nr:metallophosphoesterase [Acidobacteriota bacterium]